MIKVRNKVLYADTKLRFRVPIVINDKKFYLIYFFNQPIPTTMELYVLFSDDKGYAYIGRDFPVLDFVASSDSIENENYLKHLNETFYRDFFAYLHRAVKDRIDDVSPKNFRYFGNFAKIYNFDNIPVFVNLKKVFDKVWKSISMSVDDVNRKKLYNLVEINLFSLSYSIMQEKNEVVKSNINKYYQKLKKFYQYITPLSKSELNDLLNFSLPYSRIKNNLWTHDYRSDLAVKIIEEYRKKTRKFYIPYSIMNNKYSEIDRKITLYLAYLLNVHSITRINKFVSEYYIHRYGKEAVKKIADNAHKEQVKEILQAKGKLMGYRFYDKYFDTIRIVPIDAVEVYSRKENLYRIKDYLLTDGQIEKALSKKREGIVDGNVLVSYKSLERNNISL